MNNRIAEVRKSSNMTQKAFGERIGLSGNFIWMLEKGERIPGDRTISDICREFNVSESWLRHGEGPMFIPQTASAEMSRLFGQMVKNRDTDRERLVHMLLKLSDNELKFVKKKILEMAEMFREDEP